MLPGIQRLDLAPSSTRYIGRGFANDSTLRIVAQNFRSLDLLDLSGTSVTTLKPIEEVSIRELKIMNATIRPDNLSSLQWFDEVTDLWVGWNGKSSNDDDIYFTDSYKNRLLDAVGKMDSIRNLHLFELSLSKEDREKIPDVNLVQVK